MKSLSLGRDRSRSGVIAGLLLFTLGLAAVLAWQAQKSVADHRTVVEKVLRDYAMLAADELSRRTGPEVGYNGFYALMTALRQGSGGLVAPAALETNADQVIRRARDLVRFTFRFDPSAGNLETAGIEPSPAELARLKEALARRATSPPGDRRYETRHASVQGTDESWIFGLVEPKAGSPIVGFGVDEAALAKRFPRVASRCTGSPSDPLPSEKSCAPLLPPSLAGGAVKNDALFLRILGPSGKEFYRSGAPKEPYLGVTRPYGSDYNGMLDGFRAEVAVDPAAAGALVIGGLPRSRLPFLVGLLALTAGLILTAALQLRREKALTQLRSDFVSRVSHELRTPLTQIRMFAETLLFDRVRTEEERRRSVEIIDRESRRLTNLVENVLRFSRSERGEDRVDPRVQDVVPLARQLLIDFEPLLGGRARVLATMPERALARVDEDALRRILLNLFDNALKYGPEGQEIRFGIANGDGRVRFTVEDQGPGIPARERERVWDRYYRLPRDRASAVAGTGIGLAVVRDLTRLQGGDAMVEDVAGGGARFRVELPAGSAGEDAP